jgi:hypothetical protein
MSSEWYALDINLAKPGTRHLRRYCTHNAPLQLLHLVLSARLTSFDIRGSLKFAELQYIDHDNRFFLD